MLPEDFFREFCKEFNGKLEWSKRTKWKELIFDFFSELDERKRCYKFEKEYMGIDYVWKEISKYSYRIKLALEHEASEKSVEQLLNKEIQHLIDLKAENKIAILYPSQGEKEILLEEISKKIRNSHMRLEYEKYLIILGFQATKENIGKRKRAIKFEGFIFDNNGNKEKSLEPCTIFQKSD